MMAGNNRRNDEKDKVGAALRAAAQDRQEAAVWRKLGDSCEKLEQSKGFFLRSIQLKRERDHWLLILKAYDARSDSKVIKFIKAEDTRSFGAVISSALFSDGWKEDKPFDTVAYAAWHARNL